MLSRLPSDDWFCCPAPVSAYRPIARIVASPEVDRGIVGQAKGIGFAPLDEFAGGAPIQTITSPVQNAEDRNAKDRNAEDGGDTLRGIMEPGTNPEIEATLNELAKLTCESLLGESTELGDRSEPLLRSLLMSGFRWKSKHSLMVEVERRVKAQCGQQAMHRGGALSSLTIKLGKQFDTLARAETKQPEGYPPAKGANISSSTDS